MMGHFHVFGAFMIAIFVPLIISSEEAPYQLSIVHVNDFHAKFEPVSVKTSICKPGENEKGNCYGGIARMVTKIRELNSTLPNPLLLNAGDTFQGSLLYTLYKWNITVEMLNRIPFEATAFGNHEFDDYISGVLPYMQGLKSPLLAANMNASLHPELEGLFQPSVVLEKNGRKIGIIGCITKYTSELSKSENLIFEDEVAPVSAEAERLKAQGVDIIILLSHSGYDVDRKLARVLPHIDIIVGAHSHSFLYTGTPPSIEVPAGSYPTVIDQAEGGRRVLVVQAYCYSKYVGVINLTFDEKGEITSWSGNPLLLDSSVQEDPETKAELEPWLVTMRLVGNRKIGTSAVLLDNSKCYKEECNIGSFLTDAMVHQFVDPNLKDSWTRVAIAIMNPGAFRASMGDLPTLTFDELINSQPFGNTVDTVELQGRDLKEMFELVTYMQARSFRDLSQGRGCFQVSGIQVTYNLSAEAGSRVTELLVRCALCRVPKFYPLEPEQWYTVAMPSFLAQGGAGFDLIEERGRNRIAGRVDVDVYAEYIARESPIFQGIEGRTKIILPNHNGEADNATSTAE